ncbi:hypothetical protein ZTR_08086 [Talaromyces verruculosus]|nr:hypothetical protein ZTR_08086 [Talaromyces verruculosus]
MDNLVFLNTTNAPALSPEATKRMRGHITKSNFAKRRQRIAEKPTSKVTKKSKKTSNERLKETTELVVSSSDPTQTNQDLQLLILLTCLNPPTASPSEAEWVSLFASEPLLIDATMAVGMRHWSPQQAWQIQADACSSKALTSIIQRISWQQTYSDGFLLTIMTMAFGARLGGTGSAWDVHVDGLVQILEDRRVRGIGEPGWFCDILVLDAANYIFNFPRFWHRRVIDAISDSGGARLRHVAEICEGIITFRQSINLYHEGHFDPQFIEDESTRLRKNTQKLRRSKKNKYLYSTALSLELILYLLWPPASQSSDIHTLTKELQRTTSQFPKMPCPYMDLTSCQFIIGAVAAASGSSTRSWFIDKLTSAAKAMQDRGWGDEPYEILGRMLGADESLMVWFGMEGTENDGGFMEMCRGGY